MRRACVIDNSTLVTLTKLYHLSIFTHLNNLFHRIHVPLKVKEEYENEFLLRSEPNRRKVINQMKLNSGFLSICSKYDTISLEILKTTRGIDHGEAEAAAQHKFVNSSYVLSDDQGFIKGVKIADPYIKVLGTLHLIAWLDSLEMIVDPKAFLHQIYEHGPFKAHQLRSAYTEVASQLGIVIHRKELSRKSSLRVLGLA